MTDNRVFTREDEHRILKALSAIREPEAVFDALLDMLDQKTPYDGGLLNLRTPDRNTLVCRKIRLPEVFRDIEAAYRGYRFDVTAPDVSAVSFRENRVIRIDPENRETAPANTRERFDRWNIEEMVSVPFGVSDDIIGVVSLFSVKDGLPLPDPGRVSAVLSLFSGFVAGALAHIHREEYLKSAALRIEKADAILEFVGRTNRLFSREAISDLILSELLVTFGFDSGLVWLADNGLLHLTASRVSDPAYEDRRRALERFYDETENRIDPPEGIVASVFNRNERFYIPDAQKVMHLPMAEVDKTALDILKTPRTTLHMPVRYNESPIGVVTLGALAGVVDLEESDIAMIETLCSMAGTTIRNSELYGQVERQKAEIEDFNAHLEDKVKAQTREIENHLAEKTELLAACNRFVPYEFLVLLDKESIRDVAIGENVKKEITILFSDMRNFTSLSESMAPEEVFDFLNTYLADMGPLFRMNNGFIDKYVGDAIMALFEKADDAVRTGIAMLDRLEEFNHHQRKKGKPAIRIGVGINTGELMLGTIGETHRMETTVIGDAVNLAARIEELTKRYGTPLLITEFTMNRLVAPQQFVPRFIDQVKIRGKEAPIRIYEIYTRPE
jgi:class 3 adenylate cyclase